MNFRNRIALIIYTEERQNTNLLTQTPKEDQQICHIITIQCFLLMKVDYSSVLNEYE